ncbi:MAG: hypothetical protein E7486_07340 [Ruminococcaceae bacterium]|nr:hypothetical protein [Oscillospiraceae bacterium]
MKKLWSLLLVAAMVLTMAFTMTACGEGEESGEGAGEGETSNPTTSETGEESNPEFPEALDYVEIVPIPEIAMTGWQIAGGIKDGVEFEEADLQSVLDSCNGVLQFIFPDNDQSINIINGEYFYEGSYEVVKDGYVIHATFNEGAEYYGAFTIIDDTDVLIMCKTDAPNIAVYFTLISEQ